ncbi:hypothetical protein EVAR_50591_1 [Eumeta japonica]|uniref:Uncharacterized protein n=1 Tax=Eumeta variegata TaxID=151549 RepID=A0A4C1Y5N0_EUMVA|nr:hypothetical protein EVAR_50591_1 [Eumeta japonica]
MKIVETQLSTSARRLSDFLRPSEDTTHRHLKPKALTLGHVVMLIIINTYGAASQRHACEFKGLGTLRFLKFESYRLSVYNNFDFPQPLSGCLSSHHTSINPERKSTTPKRTDKSSRECRLGIAVGTQHMPRRTPPVHTAAAPGAELDHCNIYRHARRIVVTGDNRRLDIVCI